ncbi:hypothetical protein CDL12_08021 [Handroanthus impetiginosus]|uniref:Uncharacterized protein n=1 Tax=Handroanthus impetiginosus TaxID=429701 RepID=A0A2G9HPD2_9LAMI|nr:hypothetical protein CDL12_08021 [Handroanthus impetiginosus]
MVLPPKLRPLFLHRLEEIKLRRHAPLKDSNSSPSKKELLLDDREEDENVSSSYKIVSKNMPFCPKDQVMKYHEDKNVEKDHSKIIEDLKAKDETETETDADHDDDHDNDDDDDDERMIGHDHDRAFPRSPSFRVYFKDDGRDEHKDTGKINDASKKSAVPSDDNVSSKQPPEKNKITKSGRKKNFRKSTVKNLLSVKSCYNSPPSAHHHHQSHLLAGKTNA